MRGGGGGGGGGVGSGSSLRLNVVIIILIHLYKDFLLMACSFSYWYSDAIISAKTHLILFYWFLSVYFWQIYSK